VGQILGNASQGLVEFRHAYGIVPQRLVPRGEPPQPSAYVLSVPDERLNETLDLLAGLPGVYWADTGQFLVYTERAAQQFVPLPLIVSALALFASGTIMANTVSLATLERRREIGIMKAIGLQAEAVLGLLLLESALVGLAGGLLGVGLSALLVLPSGLLGEGSLPAGMVGLLVLLAVGLALAATTLTAYGASRERPINVLRYE
jgi:putative ABC transport system permease protein